MGEHGVRRPAASWQAAQHRQRTHQRFEFVLIVNRLVEDVDEQNQPDSEDQPHGDPDTDIAVQTARIGASRRCGAVDHADTTGHELCVDLGLISVGLEFARSVEQRCAFSDQRSGHEFGDLRVLICLRLGKIEYLLVELCNLGVDRFDLSRNTAR